MKRTSMTINEKTADIIHALNIPYQRIFDRGLIALALEGNHKDQKLTAYIRRLQQDKIEELNQEITLLQTVMDRLERVKTELKKEDIEKREDSRTEIAPIRSKVDHIGYEPGLIPEQVVERILNDRSVAARQVYSILDAYLGESIMDYGNGPEPVILALNEIDLTGQGPQIWATLKQRDDLDELVMEVVTEIKGE